MESPSRMTPHLGHQMDMLVVMAKAPRPGRVKTRLTTSLPVDAVTGLYCCLLDDTIALGRSLGMVEVTLMCPPPDVEELARLMNGTVKVFAQEGEGLAAGLTSAFANFAKENRRVIAFNSDSPHLPASTLESAFEALNSHDVVVGPTHDGGYYLVGAKAAHAGLFDGDGMGTKTALDVLITRARTLQLSIAFTDAFYDVDVAEDLTRLAAELRLDPGRAPKTAAWLAEWARLTARMGP